MSQNKTGGMSPKFAQMPGPERYGKTIWQSVGLITGLVVTGVAALVLVLLTVRPSVPAYTLTAGSLEFHEMFYGVKLQRGAVKLDEARVIDCRTDERYRLVERTNGTGLPHYKAGWFRTAAGEKVLVYAADGRRLVLLPGAGGGPTVLYEAKAPEAFVEKLRAAWK